MTSTQPADDEIQLHSVSVVICSLCLAGVGGECFVPGCAFWMCTAPTAEQAQRLAGAM